LEDLGEMGRRARGAARRIREGVLDGLLPKEALELEQALRQVQSDWKDLLERCGQEPFHA